MKQNERSREGRADAGKPRDATVNLIDTECAGSCFSLILLVAVDMATITRYSDIVQYKLKYTGTSGASGVLRHYAV